MLIFLFIPSLFLHLLHWYEDLGNPYKSKDYNNLTTQYTRHIYSTNHNLTFQYTIDSYPTNTETKLSREDIDEIISAAFAKWSSVTRLSFRQVPKLKDDGATSRAGSG